MTPGGGDHPGSPRAGTSRLERRRWEWLVLPVFAAGASCVLSWERWIQPFVDGSREMQVPARLAAGERLYRDVVYYYGPAAPWLNAVALRLFGRRWVVLEIVGAIAATALFFALYRLTTRAGTRMSAGVAVTLAAALCLGAPNGGSFLFPYAFASLLAILGGFAALAAGSAPPSRGTIALAAAGIALALLAKPELGAAAAVVLGMAALRAKDWRNEWRRTARVLFAGGGAALLGYGFAFRGMPLRELAAEGPFVLFSPPAEWRGVYEAISGLADPAASLSQLATALFLDLLIAAGVFVACRGAASPGRAPGGVEAVWWGLLLLTIAAVAFGAGARVEDRLPPLLMPAPVLAAVGALWLLRSPLDARHRARFLLFGFSALAASRVVLGLAYGYRTTPYSILALPGLIATAAVMAIDVLAARAPASRVARRCAAGVFLALAAVGLLRIGRFGSPQGSVRISTQAGALRLVAPQAATTQAVIRFLTEHARPGDSLSALPEAGIFNFATGLPNPLRQEQILPGHLDREGEARVVQRIAKTGPRFVVIVNQAHPGWGPVTFGVDFGREILREIESRYALVAVLGGPPPDTPLGAPDFFARVYERR